MKTKDLSIVDFDRISKYVLSYYEFRKSKDLSFSYKRFAKSLGFSALSTVAMVACEKRKPTPDFVSRLGRALKFTESEKRFADALLGFERSRSDADRELFATRLQRLRPRGNSLAVDLDKFNLISNWIHFAILEMSNLRGFVAESSWIARHLKFKTSTKTIQTAISRLERVGLFHRNADGNLVRNADHVFTTSGVPSSAIRTFHREMLDHAKHSLESQSIDERFLTGLSVTIDAARMGEAREFIEECRDEFTRRFEKLGGDQTVHLALQIFQLARVERNEK